MKLKCQRCKSERIATASGRCKDMFTFKFKQKEYEGYVLQNIGFHDQFDYLTVEYCLECGQIQENFPVPDPNI